MAIATIATAPSVYEELGVTPLINACGHKTVLGGSTPSPAVKAAMERADAWYVDMPELLERAGRAVAGLLGAEAATITPGCAAAMALGAAACVAGDDPDLIARLPHTGGLKDQVVIQAGQRYHYEHVVTIVGTTLVAAGDDNGTSAAQLAATLSPRTAAVLYPAHMEGVAGALSLADTLEVAHDKGVPVLVDAAGQVYPLERFTGYARMGADLVCFGAKYLGAPHSSGILCGRRDLVAAAARQGFIGFETSSRGRAFGRPFKLDRQEIVAVVAALQEWMSTDHAARLAGYEARLGAIARAVEGAPGVAWDLVRGVGANPRLLRIRLDPATARLDAARATAALRTGRPAIAVGGETGALLVHPGTLAPGQEAIVAARLRELLA
jgi:D-glucosaminate-6-phosphate ammonia-lyase